MLRIIICSLLSLLLLSPVQALINQSDPTQIIVSAKGTIKTPADLVYITLGANETDSSARQAQAIVARKMTEIIKKLKSSGVSQQQLETTRLNLSPSYKYGNGESRLIGYTAENLLKITIKNLDNVGQIIDTAIEAGANKVNNIIFTLKDDSAHKKMALDKAFKTAKAKAKALAAAAGLSLTRIVKIQEAGAVVAENNARAFMAGKGGSGTTVVPGRVEVKANVTVVYECR